MELKKILNQYEIEDGVKIPKGYGFAYTNILTMKTVFYPIPINLLVNFYLKIKRFIIAPSQPKREKELWAAYQKGRRDGVRLMQKRMEEVYQEMKKERGWP